MSGGRVGALVAMAAVVALGAGCGGGGGGEKIIPLATTPTSVAATTGGPAPTAPPTLSARDVANRFEQLLEQNAGARAQVSQAVQGVGNCTVDPRQAHDTLGAVVNTRKALVDQVNVIDVGALPEGSNLKSNLVQAWQASIAADVHFQAWALDVADAGCVRNGVNSGPDWDAANTSSIQATQFKQNFSTVWAAVAPRYGLRTWAENEL
ncbi:MAG TPA: hypothetical protein VFA83_04355 [Acidimicrobiales bacterium]|nr:hypothetical protein [Acidimicrobiales bacterium]